MPFPWKKSKDTRISRLFADLQTLPKRRGSLVVETGFPTSLIDLFVKNQEKLRRKSAKSSKKKHERSTRDMHRSVLDSPNSNSTDPSSASPVSGSALCGTETPSACETARIDGAGIASEDASEARFLPSDARVEDEDRVSWANAAFLAVLKVSVVVILAFGTKQLAVGITMSAFMLLFLEFAGKYLDFYRRPSPIRRGLILNWRKQDAFECKEIERVDKPDIPTSRDLAMGLESCSSIDEIEVVQCDSDSVSPKNSNENAMEKDEDGIEAPALHKGPSAKLRARMIRRLVPKKLRSSKKGKKPMDNEQQELCEAYTIDKSEGLESGEKSMSSSSSSSYSEGGGGGTETDAAAIPSVGNPAQANAETARDRDLEERLTQGKSKLMNYLILLPIVLAGLVGGRVLALVLTIAGSLVLKSVGKRRRSKSAAIVG